MSGRPPTRQLTVQFVLRTLKRLQMMTRLDQQRLAELLVAKHLDVLGLGVYLVDVAECMKAGGWDPYAHPNGACAQCGGEIFCDHNGAKYCSARCRQRAYRLRFKHRLPSKKRNKSAVRDVSYAADDKTTGMHTEAAA